MKLKLPDGSKIILDTTLNYEQRLGVVNNVLQEWDWYFRKGWQLSKTKNCLNALTDYLVLVKEEEDKNKEDKEILSLNKLKKMQKGDSRIAVFSDLPIELQGSIGVTDYSDDDDKYRS